MNPETRQFILDHRYDDPLKLALRASAYPGVDMPLAVTQIAGRQKLKDKVPLWAACDDLLYPSGVPLEQCSSEATALYKKQLARRVGYLTDLADLTGGLGIDCGFLSTLFERTTYIERQEELCRLAEHNFAALGLTGIEVRHADGVELLPSLPRVGWLYIDPARRDKQGGKVVGVADCEPDVSALEPLLLDKAQRVLLKLSPMLDLTQALRDLRHVLEAHVVSVDNECKELLLVLGKEPAARTSLPVTCVNLRGHRPADPPLVFCRADEEEARVDYATAVLTYLYEPNASILKAGAFRTVAARYGLLKLHPNSHLYTSGQRVPDFPGRVFKTLGTGSLNKTELKSLLYGLKAANLTVRNFPQSTDSLRKRLRLADGGDTYLFATTLYPDRKVMIRCQSAS